MEARHRASGNQWALWGALTGIAVIIAIPGYAYYQQVIAPGNATVVSIDGHQLLSTRDLVRAVVVRQMLSNDPTDLSGLGRAPFVVADDALNGELLRSELAARGAEVTAADIEAVIRTRFHPTPQAGDLTSDAEPDRLYRETYTRFLAERAVLDSEFRKTVEQTLLSVHMAATMAGGTLDLNEWLRERRTDQQAEVNLGSAIYARVLDEVRASLPRGTNNQQVQQ